MTKPDKPIPYGRHNITEKDIQSVVETLQSNNLTQGPKIAEFEKKFAEYIGCKYAVAVANGTAALHICAMALDVKEGDKVITTPVTFSASANCIRYCGGEVVFSDINSDTYLLDFDKVEELVKSKPKGTFKGIIPVDFAGRAVNLEKFRDLADEYGMWIIEDACHAPGGYFIDSKGADQFCGNGEFTDLAIFSFHPVKHIACGEGGMITANDEKLYKQFLKLRSHGIVKDNNLYLNTPEFANGVKGVDTYPGWYMEMQTLGYNYRLTDFQSALGISQLERADEGLRRRRDLARKYNEAFKDKPYIKGQSELIEGHAYHLYVIEAKDRLGLYNFLWGNNVYSQIHYIPVHLMPYYRALGWKEGDMPNAEDYYRHCMSLPMYPTLRDEEQDYVIHTIMKYYE